MLKPNDYDYIKELSDEGLEERIGIAKMVIADKQRILSALSAEQQKRKTAANKSKDIYRKRT